MCEYTLITYTQLITELFWKAVILNEKTKNKKKTELCSRLFNYDSCSVISWKTNYTDTCEGQLSGAASIREPVIIVIIIVVIYLE